MISIIWWSIFKLPFGFDKNCFDFCGYWAIYSILMIILYSYMEDKLENPKKREVSPLKLKFFLLKKIH